MFIQPDLTQQQFICHGEWILKNIPQIKKDLKNNPFPSHGAIKINGSAVTLMDSAGSWLLIHAVKQAEKLGLQTQLEHFSEQQTKLLSLIKKEIVSANKIPT